MVLVLKKGHRVSKARVVRERKQRVRARREWSFVEGEEAPRGKAFSGTKAIVSPAPPAWNRHSFPTVRPVVPGFVCNRIPALALSCLAGHRSGSNASKRDAFTGCPFFTALQASGECVPRVPGFPGVGQNVIFARNSSRRAPKFGSGVLRLQRRHSVPAWPKADDWTFWLPK